MSLKLIIPPWAAVGFYRGIKKYDYDYKKECMQHEKNKQPQYFYSTCISVGFFGLFLYVNPFLFPIILGKELHRLEVNIRGLDEEKDKKDYNDIF
jgi:hypothetical protein